MESKYKPIWSKLLKNKKLPSKFTGVKVINYKDLKILKNQFSLDNAENLINEFLDGKVLIVKKVFDDDIVKYIKKKVINFWNHNPDTYFKMIENCPDFHRVITPEIAKNYVVGAVRHTTYFFPWNNDPCKFNETIYERWRYCKYIGGLKFNEYESNTPRDGSVDRIQIVCYPPKYGGVETHIDTYSNNNLAISCYLSSKNNLDFQSGGFYCLDKENKEIDLESYIDAGDMSLYCPTIEHGVKAIDEHSKIDNYDWYSGTGRWWMGLFTNDSNLTKNRKTSKSLSSYHSQKFENK